MFKQRIINKIRTSIWLYPTMYSLVALALALVVSYLDWNLSSQISGALNGLFYTTVATAQNVLGIIAGAFITIATFTFSTTMVVLTMYSSQFTPRVVENFLNNETTMKSFGVFLSGFIYSIVSLLTMSTRSRSGDLVMVASVGVVYIIMGLIYFLVFIHNVSTYIQANGLIRRLDQEAMAKIKNYRNFVAKAHPVSNDGIASIIKDLYFAEVYSDQDGYIQEIDYPRLKGIAQNHQCVVFFEKVVGQFVSKQTRIINVYYRELEPLDQSIIKDIQNCIMIGVKKTEAQDFNFTIQKIVEIALRALSPGINDPYTAIHCLKIIGLLLRDLAEIEKGHLLVKDHDAQGFILYESYDFEVVLYEAYHQIVHYGHNDSSVMVALFKSLRLAKGIACPGNLEVIDGYAKALFDKIKGSEYDKMEYSRIYNEYKDALDFNNQEKKKVEP
ncbi:MAG: DUF2254 domain-containing protein [Erysipelotrichaceae bacterium]|nr:DUF2254 domain-containing protein [Erysipelotrichaceae bacterium]MDD3810072.1 DUF2254 domain-containing protein [Erysipelotrichaceae bacterium]